VWKGGIWQHLRLFAPVYVKFKFEVHKNQGQNHVQYKPNYEVQPYGHNRKGTDGGLKPDKKIQATRVLVTEDLNSHDSKFSTNTSNI